MAQIGFEIHRIISYDKLFCKCRYFKSKPTIKFKNRCTKVYNYVGHHLCDYEKDDMPGILNTKHVERAVRSLSNIPQLQFVKNLVFSRKVILDGSLTCGFQKTALLAINGVLKINELSIPVSEVYIEEDSSQKISRRSYNASRQGCVLLEIVTAPIEMSAETAVEVLKGFEKHLNCYNVLPKGIEAIRQDINISTQNNTCYVELKGINKLSLAKIAIEKEIERQKNGYSFETRYVKSNGQSMFLRRSQRCARLKQETEIPAYTLKFNKRFNINSYSLFEHLNNYHLSPRVYKILTRWDKRYTFESNDLRVFAQCLKKYSVRNALRHFFAYLNNEISYTALKNQLSVPAIDLQKCKHLFDAEGGLNFFKKYKIYIPRSFKYYGNKI